MFVRRVSNVFSTPVKLKMNAFMRDGFKRRLEDFKMKRYYFSVAEKLEELINSREKTRLNVRVFVVVKLSLIRFYNFSNDF